MEAEQNNETELFSAEVVVYHLNPSLSIIYEKSLDSWFLETDDDEGSTIMPIPEPLIVNLSQATGLSEEETENIRKRIREIS